jgi:ABC-type transport system substrate-binding protein
MTGQKRILAILLGVLAVVVLIVGGLSAVLLLSGGRGGGSAQTQGAGSGAAVSKGTLRLPGADPITLDPALVSDSGSAEYAVEIFSGLMTINPKLEIVPDLAESYTVSDDGKVYTFKLRDNALFHDGRRVEAADVKCSIERAAARETVSPTAPVYLNDIVGATDKMEGRAKDIKGIEVVDARTVRFTIDAAKPYFLAKLTYTTAIGRGWATIDSSKFVTTCRMTRRPKGWKRNTVLSVAPNRCSAASPISI